MTNYPRASRTTCITCHGRRTTPALAPFACEGWLRTIPELNADERWDLNIPFIETAIEGSARGLTMSFDELEQLASRVRQVIWGEFVAARSEATLPLRTADPAAVGRDALEGLLAIDTKFWIVGGPAVVIDRVVGAVSDVDERSSEDWIAAEW